MEISYDEIILVQGTQKGGVASPMSLRTKAEGREK